MKILILASDSGSLLNFRAELLTQMVKNGLEVYAAAPNLIKGGEDFEALTSLRVKPINLVFFDRTSLGFFNNLLALLSVIKLLFKIKPDIIFAYTIKPVIYGLIASRIIGIKNRYALITGLGYSFTDSVNFSFKRLLVKNLVSFLYKLSLINSSKVFFQNPDDKKLFYELNIIDNNTSVAVVNGSGVNLQKFEKQDFSNNINLTFLMISRIIKDKGVEEYLIAASEILENFPNVKFQIAGPIDKNPEAINMIKFQKLTKTNGIEYLGQIKDVRRILADCSVFVLPSYREGTPRSVLEAMAVGRCIITTDVPGCRETVIDGYNGLLVKAKNVDALKAAFLKVIRNEVDYRKMGDNSAILVEEKYDVTKVNNFILTEMQDIYNYEK